MKIYSRKGVIYIDYSVDGKRHRKSTKLPDTKANYKLVQHEVIPQLQASIVRGEYQQVKKTVSFQEFAYQSLELHRHERKPAVNYQYKQVLELHILPIFKNHIISHIKPLELQEWQNTVIDKTSKGSLSKFRNVFRGIMQDAVTHELIDSNPFVRVKHVKSEKEEIVPFAKDEIELILLNSFTTLKHFFVVAVFTGMRTGEQIALEWNDINFSYKTIRINKTRNRGLTDSPKTESSKRTIEMLPIVEEYLLKQHKITKEHNNVFINSRGKEYYSSDTLNLSLARVIKKIGIPKRVLYNTRHTFASMMLSNNENIMWVSSTMGHASANITLDKYARFIKDNSVKRAKFIENWHIFGTQETEQATNNANKGVVGED